MRKPVCGRSACLQRDWQQQEDELRRGTEATLRQQQAVQWGAQRAERLRFAWLPVHRAWLAPVDEARRESLRAHLHALLDGDDPDAAPGPAGRWALSDTEAHVAAAGAGAADAATCGTCQGRCCRLGGQHQAFLGAPQLRRWLRDHPGSTGDDAVRAYLQALPDEHVDESCSYHGAQGCTLPRDWRADVCNVFVCDVLHSVRSGPDSDWIVAMSGHGQLMRSTLLEAQAPAHDVTDRSKGADRPPPRSENP